MTRPRAILLSAAFFVVFAFIARAQDESGWVIDSDEGIYEFRTGLATFTNRVVIKFSGSVLTADSASVNQHTGEAVAKGRVRIQQDDQLWAGEHIRYNFKTHQMVTEQFRTGKSPVLAAGQGLGGDITNRVYNATNAFVTTDDVAEPAITVRARHIRIIPGRRIEATHATLYFGDVPVFYFPYYSRSLAEYANSFNFTPGYRSRYGAFVLGRYTWFLSPELDGALHLDYRQKRGVGAGPDLNFHLGRWGDGTVRYYYLRDDDAGTNLAGVQLPQNRQRVDFSYQATPFTNLNFKSRVRYQGDSDVVKNFFEGDYRENPQPDTFVEVNKFWRNFSLDILARPRVNDFNETVERLPDVRLTGFRQQVGGTPFYYESESSAGWYRRLFAETNSVPTGMDFEAARADSYHQITLPRTFFGWLNFTPRAGGRVTWYSRSTGPAGTNDEACRGVFNTGAEISYKASRLWPRVQDKFLDLDGLRHIVEPSINYVYVPVPNYRPGELPRFDYELPSLRLLPIEFPDYNAIDSIDSQNVLRFGLGNRLQTKRDGRVEDLLNWAVAADWRLRPRADQRTYGDLFSDLALKPRSWITVQSQTRFDANDGRSQMLLHTLTLEPNDVWSWTFGHFYLRDDFSDSPTALGQGNDLIISSFFYRLNENWGLRARHHFDVRSGRLQEQFYSIYRDMRSWTAALTAGVRESRTGSEDFTIAFTFSLKAMPRYGLGSDTVRPYSLLGQ